MDRLTTDKPTSNVGHAHNLFYAKDGMWTWIRGGGPAPDYKDISLCSFARKLCAEHIPDEDLPADDVNLNWQMSEWLLDGPESLAGLIALLYTAGWAFADLRQRLKYYEDLQDAGRLTIWPEDGQTLYYDGKGMCERCPLVETEKCPYINGDDSDYPDRCLSYVTTEPWLGGRDESQRDAYLAGFYHLTNTAALEKQK